MEKCGYTWEYLNKPFEVEVEVKTGKSGLSIASVKFHTLEMREYFENFNELKRYIDLLGERLIQVSEAVKDMEQVYSFYKKLVETKEGE